MRISDWSSDVCSSDLLGAAALEVVDQAAGGGDEDVHAAAQVVDLRAHAGATEDGGDVQAQVAAIGLDAVGELHGEPARGHQHQSSEERPGGKECGTNE